MPAVFVRRTWLVLRARAALRPTAPPRARGRVHLARRVPCPVAEYRALYAAVGAAWHWHDRDAWSDARLAAHLAHPAVEIHVLTEDDAPVGYFELERHPDGYVEILYFGLVPAAHGRGLGGWLLERAAEAAFDGGARGVWLHTCSLDGAAALPNYLARGFRPFRTMEYVTVID